MMASRLERAGKMFRLTGLVLNVVCAKKTLKWWCFNTAMQPVQTLEVIDLRVLCPKCGQDNACAVARGGQIEDCWCVSAQISAQVLVGLAPEQGCICAQCAQA